jgi:hypothetical protein
VPSMSRGFHFFPCETFFPHVIHSFVSPSLSFSTCNYHQQR